MLCMTAEEVYGAEAEGLNRKEDAMKYLLSLVVLVALVLGNSYTARTQDEVTVMAAGSIRGAIEQLTPGAEGKTGHGLKATYARGDIVNQRIAQGEASDVPILQAPYPEYWLQATSSPAPGRRLRALQWRSP